MTDCIKELYEENNTYEDYLSWPDDGSRYEILQGEVYMMASPSQWHQDMILSLGSQLKDFLEGKPCAVLIAPFDVRLFPVDDQSDETVVQPDVLVVCDQKKLDGKACKGPPDFVIEVVSPGSKALDLHQKKDLYFKSGVKEYWAVTEQSVIVHLLEESYKGLMYMPKEKGKGMGLPVSTLPGCTLAFFSNAPIS